MPPTLAAAVLALPALLMLVLGDDDGEGEGSGGADGVASMALPWG